MTRMNERPTAGWAACAAVLVVGMLNAAAGGAADYRSIAESATIFYDAPSSKSKRLFVLGAGYPLEVMVSLEGWTKVRDVGGSIGWVEARALSAKRMVVVRANVAEARAAPEAGAKSAFKVARGVMLEWIETLPTGWTRVSHPEAGPAFILTADLWGS
jgi:SH3-like domain-containing protein